MHFWLPRTPADVILVATAVENPHVKKNCRMVLPINSSWTEKRYTSLRVETAPGQGTLVMTAGFVQLLGISVQQQSENFRAANVRCVKWRVPRSKIEK